MNLVNIFLKIEIGNVNKKEKNKTKQNFQYLDEKGGINNI